MKKILSIILLACLTLAATAQVKPQAMKTFMAKEHLSNTLHSLQQPARQQTKLVTEQPAAWTTAAKAPAKKTTTTTKKTTVAKAPAKTAEKKPAAKKTTTKKATEGKEE